MGRWCRWADWKLPGRSAQLLVRRQLGWRKAGLPSRAPRLPAGPELPGMLRQHAQPSALLLLSVPGSRLHLQRVIGWEGLLQTRPRAHLHLGLGCLQLLLPLLLLRMNPRHVQLPRPLRALLLLHPSIALHLLWRLLQRVASWHKLKVHPLRSHGDMHHMICPREWHARVAPSLMRSVLRWQALMCRPKGRGLQHGLAGLHVWEHASQMWMQSRQPLPMNAWLLLEV